MKILVYIMAWAATGGDPAPAAAAPVVPKVVVVGPTTRPAGRSIMLDGTASATSAPLRWRLERFDPDRPTATAAPPLLLFDKEGRKSVYACILDPDPGKYWFSTVAIGDDGDGDGVADIDVGITLVSVQAPTPPVVPPTPIPTPTPGPTPTPDPTPAVQGKIHVSLILDPATMTTALAKVRADPDIERRMNELDADWHAYWSKSADVKKYNYGKTIRDRGVPLVIVQDATGRVIDAWKDFASSDDLVARVARLRGK
jgi:hypothetical protein